MAKHQPHEPSYTARKLNIASEKGCLENYFSFGKVPGFRCLFRGENCDVSREKTLLKKGESYFPSQPETRKSKELPLVFGWIFA